MNDLSPRSKGSRVMDNRTVVPNNNKGSSLRMIFPCSDMGVMIAAEPRIRPRLARFDPVMLPKASSD